MAGEDRDHAADRNVRRRRDPALRQQNLGRYHSVHQARLLERQRAAVQLSAAHRHGFGYQVFYVFSRAFRVGGNTFRDNVLYPAALFAPGVIPQGMDVGTTLQAQP